MSCFTINVGSVFGFLVSYILLIFYNKLDIYSQSVNIHLYRATSRKQIRGAETRLSVHVYCSQCQPGLSRFTHRVPEWRSVTLTTFIQNANAIHDTICQTIVVCMRVDSCG